MKVVRSHIFKRIYAGGNESWVVRWKSPDSGAWRSVAAGKNKSEAQIVEARIREQLLRGELPFAKADRKETTFTELAREFFESPRFKNSADHYQKVVRLRLESEVIPYFGKTVLSTLTKARLIAFYMDLKERGRCHATIRKYHFTICLLFDILSERDPNFQNPARQIIKFSRVFPKQAPTRDIDALGIEETKKLLSALKRCRGVFTQPLLSVLAFTGMRRSEALALKWTDFDLSEGFIRLRKTKTARPRSIPLESETWEAIRHLKQGQEYIFQKQDGSRPDKDSFLRPLKRAAKRAGIEKRVDLHMLRHSYGSNKLRIGWGLKQISKALGHSDISITANIYTHLLDGDYKLRDDYRFDKGTRSENSNQAPDPTPLLTNALMELTASLKTLSRDKLDLASNENEVMRQMLARVLQDAGLGLNRVGPSESGSLNQTSPDVALMSREAFMGATEASATDVAGTDSSLDLSGLGGEKDGDPEWSRTTDLQLRRLTLYPTELRDRRRSSEVTHLKCSRYG